MRPCCLCFHGEEPRIPQELRKDRKSRSSGSRTLFPAEKARERKKEVEEESHGREKDLIDRTTVGKGQLSREFCREIK